MINSSIEWQRCEIYNASNNTILMAEKNIVTMFFLDVSLSCDLTIQITMFCCFFLCFLLIESQCLVVNLADFVSVLSWFLLKFAVFFHHGWCWSSHQLLRSPTPIMHHGHGPSDAKGRICQSHREAQLVPQWANGDWMASLIWVTDGNWMQHDETG